MLNEQSALLIQLQYAGLEVYRYMYNTQDSIIHKQKSSKVKTHVSKRTNKYPWRTLRYNHLYKRNIFFFSTGENIKFHQQTSSTTRFFHYQLVFSIVHPDVWLPLCLDYDIIKQCERWVVWPTLAQVTGWCTHVFWILIVIREMQLM